MATDLRAVLREQSSFLLEFYKRVDAEKNAVVSPLSISVALAMAAAGAKGETLAQMSEVLKLPKDEAMHAFAQQIHSVLLTDASAAGGPVLSIANSTWVEHSLKLSPSFQEAVAKNYGAEAMPADFVSKAEESRQLINAWVLSKTKGKIQDLLPAGSVDHTTRMILANAMYFKGAWLNPFDASCTQEGTFYLASGEAVLVPMMRSSSKKMSIRRHGSFKVLRLPYHAGSDARSFSMYVLLPNDRNGLPELVRSLENGEQLESSLSYIREVDVGNFMLPKFKLSFSVEAAEVLKSMGLQLPFSSHADFSNIAADASSSSQLFVSDVFHKAFVEVNEEGTEAAAATAVTITLKSISFAPPEDFVADHPFMFLIREDATGLVLLFGHVNNPAAGA